MFRSNILAAAVACTRAITMQFPLDSPWDSPDLWGWPDNNLPDLVPDNWFPDWTPDWQAENTLWIDGTELTKDDFDSVGNRYIDEAFWWVK